jgi:predicted phage terminase large subunit-like protein
LGFVQLHRPQWTLAHFQLHLIDILDKFEKGTLTHRDIGTWPPGVDPDKVINKLAVNMPPRHAKTEFCTKLFPAYYMARNPSRYVMSSAYNSELAKEFGREARDWATDAATKQAFPALEVRKDSSAADEWRTTAGGAYFGVGLGGTTSGRPATLLIIDDPIKSREEADSATNRNKVWSYYTSALGMRLQPEVDGSPHKQLVILTRWHPDDLVGRLQDSDEWKNGEWGLVVYPAITEDAQGNEIPLWPERFPLAELKRRKILNEREFAALYMQSPFIAGGNLIKSNWWQYYDPADEQYANLPVVIIALDTAFKTQEQNDYSAFAVLAMDRRGDIFIKDIRRAKLAFPDLKVRAIQMNSQWRGKGLRGLYIEDKASGQSLIQELKRESGVAVIPYRVNRDKVARVNTITPLIEGGRVYLPERAPWLDDFLSEATQFPAGAHDDMVDAVTLGLDVLSRMAQSPDAMAFTVGESLVDLAQQSLLHSVASTQNNHWKGWGEL